jgi:hypothetical protein
VTAIPAPIIHNFMPTVKCSVSGVLTGYFKVPETAQYEFRLAGTNVGGSVSINNKTLILANLEMEELRTTRPVFLEKDRIHKLLIDFFSFSDKTRSINLSYRVREVGDFATLNTTFISQNGTCFNFALSFSRLGEFELTFFFFCFLVVRK